MQTDKTLSNCGYRRGPHTCAAHQLVVPSKSSNVPSTAQHEYCFCSKFTWDGQKEWKAEAADTNEQQL